MISIKIYKNKVLVILLVLISLSSQSCEAQKSKDNQTTNINSNTKTNSVSEDVLDIDTLTFSHFKKLVSYRTQPIPDLYIKKFTSLKVKNIGGYLYHEDDKYELLVLQKLGFEDSKFAFVLYDKQGNETDKLIVQLCKDQQGCSSDIDLSKIFSNQSILIVEHFDTIFHKRKILSQEKANLNFEYFHIKEGKWVKK